jgi:hypothetical protein
MSSRETEFCRHQAERLHRLAAQCVDPEIRKQVAEIAEEWAKKARAKKEPLLQSVK